MMDPSICPEEIWIKILLYCDVLDIINFSHTCQYLEKICDIDCLWKVKWLQLISKVHFSFPDIKCLQLLNVSFKEMCYRLYMITEGENFPFPKCDFCGIVCQRSCVEYYGTKAVFEIGNKDTWISLSSLKLRRHFPMRSFINLWNFPIQYLSNKSNTFCLFRTSTPCQFDKEKEQTSKIAYCIDTIKTTELPNLSTISPADTLLKDGMFPVLKDFIDHFFHQIEIKYTLSLPNTVFTFCEPLGIHPATRKQLLHYLFQEVKVSRVCLIPKPLALCAMLDVETCVVVDSGALSTTVSVVIGGRVISDRCKLLPVGGWHVAYFLQESISPHIKKYCNIPISQLDGADIKQKCTLSFNPKHEKNPTCPESKVYFEASNASEAKFVTHLLREELYIAPEVMYTHLGLPQVIKDVTHGLSDEMLHDCLSHILLTGGNVHLPGFQLRLNKDLRELMPEHNEILEVIVCAGIDTWNLASTYTYVPLTVYPDKIPPEYIEGNPFWLSREEYILFGCESLER